MSVEPTAREHSAAAEFDHHDPAVAARIHDEYTRLRSQCPVGWSTRHDGFWVVTDWADVHDLARDTQHLSSRVSLIPNVMGEHVLIPISLDPPEHSTYRALLQRWFTPARIGSFEGYIRSRARGLLAASADTSAEVVDLATQFARPLPLDVILTVIGVPTTDIDVVAAGARAAIEDVVVDPAGAAEKIDRAYGYLANDLVPTLRDEPRDDLVSFLTTTRVDGEPLPDDMVASIAFNIVGAGFDTTYKSIASSLAHLATEPDSQRALRSTNDLSVAVEELLRLFAPVSAGRVVTRDVERGGARLRAGDAVLLVYPAAGRDPAVFDRPDEPDFARRPNRHLTFGTGIHRCLGMHLARLELRVALEEVFRATSWFEVDVGREPAFHQSQVWGATSVPVRIERLPGQAR